MSLAERLGQASIVLPGPTRASQTTRAYDAGSEHAQVKAEVQDLLVESMGTELYSGRVDAVHLEGLVFDAIQTVLARNPRPLSGGDRARIVQEVIDDVLGNGPLEPLLRDPDVTEIMVSRYDTICTEKCGRVHGTALGLAGAGWACGCRNRHFQPRIRRQKLARNGRLSST